MGPVKPLVPVLALLSLAPSSLTNSWLTLALGFTGSVTLASLGSSGSSGLEPLPSPADPTDVDLHERAVDGDAARVDADEAAGALEGHVAGPAR